jgi:hemerythrin-like domain-containing protein
MNLELAELDRRGATALAAALAAGVLVSAGGLIVPAEAAPHSRQSGKSKHKKEARGEHGGGDGEDVSATEDLMREHGVLRRTLIVYSELAARLQAGARDLDPAALADAARLFREFGEQYHERTLEEQYVFPEVRRAGDPNEKLVEVLFVQHQRGREITDYLLRVGARGQIGGDAVPLASALASMARMYHAHAAWEDTVIFPAWKKTQSKSRLHDLAEKFEEIEHQQFGKDGFDDAVARISRIEQTLGLADLGSYTAPPAPTSP